MRFWRAYSKMQAAWTENSTKLLHGKQAWWNLSHVKIISNLTFGAIPVNLGQATCSGGLLSHIFPSEPWNADEFHVFPMKRRRTFRISHLNHLRQPLPFSIFPESWKVEKASQGQVACYFKSQNKGSFWCFAYICFWKHKLTPDIICKCFWSSSFNLAQVKRPSQATPASPAAMQISWLWPGCIQAWRIWAWTMVSKGNQGL